jgi:hypothetical protein
LPYWERTHTQAALRLRIRDAQFQLVLASAILAAAIIDGVDL